MREKQHQNIEFGITAIFAAQRKVGPVEAAEAWTSQDAPNNAVDLRISGAPLGGVQTSSFVTPSAGDTSCPTTGDQMRTPAALVAVIAPPEPLNAVTPVGRLVGFVGAFT
jgi:hypothetical protein